MNRKIALLAALACAVVAAPFARAVTYVVPPDRELVARAALIFVGTVTGEHCELNSGGGVFTVIDLTVDELLKGDVSVGDTIRLFEPGGEVGTRKTVVFGAPHYKVGARHLVFTDFDGEGRRTTVGLGLGDFGFGVGRDGKTLAIHEAEIYGFDAETLDGHVERARFADDFLQFIRDVVSGHGEITRDYFVNEAESVSATQSVGASSTFTMRSYIGYSGGVYRWATPIYAFNTNGAQPPSDAATSASTASSGVGRWNGAGGSNVHITVSGTTSSTSGLSSPDHQNTILFNDPANEFPQLAGLAGAVGGINAESASQPLPDGSGSAISPTEVDIVVAKNFSPISCLSIILTHESGHTLGFRHADRDSSENPCALPLDCSNGSAVMNANPSCGLSSLQLWDGRAVGTLYGPGCIAASVTTGPTSIAITAGNSTTLSVGVDGTSPFTYQWYIGAKSDTSSPIGGQTASSVTVSPITTTSYWVRVTNSCGTADSNAATVTVNPCNAPQVTQQPSSQAVSFGGQAQFSVTASGSATLSYQWYIGASGNTSQPVNGATSATLTTTPNGTTQYWVKVTNSCGSANSNSATVAVNCVAPGVVTQPQSKSIQQGSSTFLSVAVSGGPNPTYQWYRGNQGGDVLTAVSGATTATISVAPTATTSYWVRITVSGCGTVDSNLATVTVTVNPNCPTVTIANPTVVQNGSSFTLATSASTGSGGGTVNIIWLDGSLQTIGTGNSIIVSPTVTTTYTAQATNTCGSSATATVTVSIGCAAPGITQPGDQSIGLGSSTTITVIATGSGVPHYQWYQGAAGDTSNPIGTDSASVVTGSLTTTSSFWVKVSNDCSTNTTSSSTITVAVAPARRRPSRH